MTVSESSAGEQGGWHLIPGRPSAFPAVCGGRLLCSQASMRRTEWDPRGGLLQGYYVYWLIRNTRSGEEQGVKPSLSSDRLSHVPTGQGQPRGANFSNQSSQKGRLILGHTTMLYRLAVALPAPSASGDNAARRSSCWLLCQLAIRALTTATNSSPGWKVGMQWARMGWLFWAKVSGTVYMVV